MLLGKKNLCLKKDYKKNSNHSQISKMAEQQYMMHLPIVHAGPGSIFIPTPGAFVVYVNDMNNQFVKLEEENESLKLSLEGETSRADTNQTIIDELRDELKKSKPIIAVKTLEDDIQSLKLYHQTALVGVQHSLSVLEKDIVNALSDPRLKELDRRLTRLGRELKKNEGVDRVIMELETENAFLHNEIDGLNSLLKGFKAADGEFKKFKVKMFDTNRKLEVQAISLEAIIQELEDDKKKLVEALFIKAASEEIAASRRG